MKALDAAILTALAVAVILAVAWRRSRGRHSEPYCPGPQCPPHNLGLYDAPHQGYPFYEGRAALAWDADGRCAASCAQLPCAIWCR